MKFKDSFAKNSDQIRMNNAGLAPYPTQAFDAIKYWNERIYREGIFAEVDGVSEYDKTRVTLANFLGCETSELAFMQSAAHAISQVAFGLKLQVGDEIIIWDQEYPSNYYPWLRAAERANGKLVTVKSGEDFSTPVEKLLEAITPRTRVIAVSWVQYQTGAVTDLETLSAETRKRDIWLVVDGIQAIGARTFNFKNYAIDALCGGSHKWLCSPLSTGYLAVRKERLQELEPIMVGALTYGTYDDRPRADLKPHGTGQRFEPGARSTLPLFALKATLDLMNETGMDLIEKECLRLADRLRDGLLQHDYVIHTSQKNRTPIVTFSSNKKTPAELLARAQKFKIAAGLRGPGLRLSPHAFNTDEEIDLVLRSFGPARTHA